MQNASKIEKKQMTGSRSRQQKSTVSTKRNHIDRASSCSGDFDLMLTIPSFQRTTLLVVALFLSLALPRTGAAQTGGCTNCTPITISPPTTVSAVITATVGTNATPATS